jgi:fructose-1,6-bisphosphatase II
MRARSGTIRKIESEHHLNKLRAYSAINFDAPS